MDGGTDEHDDVVRLEEELLRPTTRRSPERLRELLHPAFTEVGASGRRWDRAAVISALAAEQAPAAVRLERPEVAVLGPDVLLLTYEALADGRRSARSSVWVRDGAVWRLRFHQGTPLPDAPHPG